MRVTIVHGTRTHAEPGRNCRILTERGVDISRRVAYWPWLGVLVARALPTARLTLDLFSETNGQKYAHCTARDPQCTVRRAHQHRSNFYPDGRCSLRWCHEVARQRLTVTVASVEFAQ